MNSEDEGRVLAAESAALPLLPRRFGGFDGLRAIAAVSVLLVHTAFISGFTFKSSLGIYTARFEIGVSIFFLISGFLLYRPYAISHLTGHRAPNTRRFWERRLLRIVPAYWLALTLLTYVFHLVDMGPGIGNALIHYLFLQIYFPAASTEGIGQAWTLCTEVSFYLLLPFFAAAIAFRRKSQENQLLRELLGVFAMYLLSVCFRWWWTYLAGLKLVSGHLQPACYPTCGTNVPFAWCVDLWLPAWTDLFALGMLLAVLSAWWSERGTEPIWLSSRWMPWLSWAGAGVVFWWVSNIGVPISPAFLPGPAIGMEMHALYGIFAFLLLLPAVFGPDDGSLIRRFLRCWPMASTGAVSYGIYLWHVGVAQKVTSATGYVLFTVPFWLLAPMVLVISTVIASISYFGLEKQALRLKGHLPWWSRPDRAQGAGADEVLSE